MSSVNLPFWQQISNNTDQDQIAERTLANQTQFFSERDHLQRGLKTSLAHKQGPNKQAVLDYINGGEPTQQTELSSSSDAENIHSWMHSHDSSNIIEVDHDQEQGLDQDEYKGPPVP